MPDYLLDAELAEIQNVLSAMENKIKYYKANYPYATYELHNMETCNRGVNFVIIRKIIYQQKIKTLIKLSQWKMLVKTTV